MVTGKMPPPPVPGILAGLSKAHPASPCVPTHPTTPVAPGKVLLCLASRAAVGKRVWVRLPGRAARCCTLPVCEHVCKCTCVHACVRVCMPARVCMCVCVCVYREGLFAYESGRVLRRAVSFIV